MIRLFVLVFLLLPFIDKAFGQSELVADIIYSEAGPTCSSEERMLVASVIYNRSRWRDRYAFYDLRTMEGVVSHFGAFESYGDHRNSNWTFCKKYVLESKLKQNKAYRESYRLSVIGYLQITNKRNKEVTHFVTKGHTTKGLVSINYKLVLVKHTKNLSFYTILDK